VVLGRALGFSDPEVIRILKEQFIPLVGDDWYQRRRKDEIGTFFRSVVDQTWKAGNWEPGGGNNRQGVYCFTSSGKMLTEMKNISGNPPELRRVLQLALASWNKLSTEERKASPVPDVNFDSNYHRPVPQGALVLRQYQRGLKRRGDGTVEGHDFKFHEAPVWAQRDRVWVLEKEWKALVPPSPAPGAVVEIPPSLRNRLFLYHFVEALVGEPGQWSPDQIRASHLKLTVESVTASSIRYALEGNVLLSTEPDTKTSRVGLEGALVGTLAFDRTKGGFDRFDLVLVADCWGALNPHNAVSRPGRNPVGFSFELGAGADVDRVPPQWARILDPYLKPPLN
jgi:hypothetical protein